MWLLKSAYTSQTASITKLLKEGFEPFAVVPLKHGDPPKADFRVYFRKYDGIEEAQPATDLYPLIETLTGFFTEFQTMVMREHKTLIERLDYLNKFVKHREIRIDSNPVVEKLTEEEPGEVDEEETIEQKGNEDVQELGDVPEGDSFRVVEDIPEDLELNNTGRTEAQDRSIEEIRKRHNTNLTIYRPDENGVVKVIVENLIYKIKPTGVPVVEETNAGTNSLVVG